VRSIAVQIYSARFGLMIEFLFGETFILARRRSFYIAIVFEIFS
jgi:hypothetical protein